MKKIAQAIVRLRKMILILAVLLLIPSAVGADVYKRQAPDDARERAVQPSQLFQRGPAGDLNLRHTGMFIFQKVGRYLIAVSYTHLDVYKRQTNMLQGISYRFCGVSTCWMIPSFMTTMRSPMVIASVWSWVT